jgi:hypothetical protein
MRRAASAVLLAVLFSAGGDAQNKKNDEPSDFFPLAKGTKWEYVLKGYEESEWVVEVTDVTEPKKGERAVVTVTTRIRKAEIVAKYSTDADGVYEHARIGADFDPPLVMIRYPVKAGTKWTEKYKYQGEDAAVEYELKAAEEVKTPAGKYTAYPVVQSIKTRLGKSTVTNWYADGVGMVKQEVRAFGKPDVLELKSFTPSKSK